MPTIFPRLRPSTEPSVPAARGTARRSSALVSWLRHDSSLLTIPLAIVALGCAEPTAASTPVGECEPSEYRCSGPHVERCDRSEQWEHVETCSDDEVCIDGACTEAESCTEDADCEQALECREGVCVPQQQCSPGELRCLGQTVERCSSDGTTWQAQEDCEMGEYCQDGVCVGATPCDDDSQCAANEACLDGFCKSDNIPEFTLSGTVLDWVDDAPIAGVEVSIDGGTLIDTTDASGHYTLPSLADGEYVITLSHSDYREEDLEVAIFDADKTFDVVLAPRRETFAGWVDVAGEHEAFMHHSPDLSECQFGVDRTLADPVLCEEPDVTPNYSPVACNELRLDLDNAGLSARVLCPNPQAAAWDINTMTYDLLLTDEHLRKSTCSPSTNLGNGCSYVYEFEGTIPMSEFWSDDAPVGCPEAAAASSGFDAVEVSLFVVCISQSDFGS